MAFEVLTIRFVSILFISLAAYLVISLAMLGYGISGGLLALRRSQQPIRSSLIALGACAYSFAILVSLFFIWNASKSPWLSSWALILALTVPFAFGGFVISAALSFPGIPINRIYFADLIGAGIGAGIVAIGLRYVDGPQLLIFMAAFGLLASGLFAGKSKLGSVVITFSVITALAALFLPIPKGAIPVSPKELALVARYQQNFQWDYQRWDPVARIDVVSVPGNVPELPAGFNYKLVMQDGGAPSALFKITSETARQWFLHQTVFGIPYWIKQQPKVLIIGVGGGPDVQAALQAGASRVVGLEVNQKMIDIARTTFATFIDDPYADPRVTIIRGDGRNYARLSQDKYDVIQLTGVDTSVASLGGNPNLAENFLYTVEAFQEFYNHLENDGVLSVSFPNVNGLGLRLVATAAEAMARNGVKHPEDQLVVSQIRGYVHVLLKKGAFTTDELDVFSSHFEMPITSFYFPLYHQLFGTPAEEIISTSRILYAPGMENTGEYGEFFAAFEQGNARQFLASQPRSVFPPTDDRPFFFILDKWGDRVNTLQILVLSLGLLAVAALILILLPPWIQNRRRLRLPGAPVMALYFCFLGLGYLIVEVNLIQRLVLFLGHPSYAIAVTLFTLLISSGLGSLWSEKWRLGFTRKIMASTFLVAMLVISEALLFDSVVRAFGSLPLWSRTLISIGLIAAPGFIMGIPFPTGMTVIRETRPGFVPWAWAINATASVMATPLSLLLAITRGFLWVFVFSALLYFSAGIAFLIYEKLWLRQVSF